MKLKFVILILKRLNAKKKKIFEIYFFKFYFFKDSFGMFNTQFAKVFS